MGGDSLCMFIADLVFVRYRLTGRRPMVHLVDSFFTVTLHSPYGLAPLCRNNRNRIQRFCGLFFGRLEGLYSRGGIGGCTCRLNALRADIVLDFARASQQSTSRPDLELKATDFL